MKQTASYGSLDCGASPLERPRYFPRQLITPAELNQAQDYFRRRMRLHNRLLHGWGTVCGTEVCRTPSEDDATRPDPWRVKIKPGYVISPQGDDVFLDGEVIVDLRTAGLEGTAGEPLAAADDPWCSRVCLPREPGPLYVAVRYKECLTRPVRVQPAGCGCEGEACEYSRVRDGYEIGILDHCPPSHEGDPPDVDVGEGPIPPCPSCPDDPWVVLAEVEVDENGIVDDPDADNPDNCSCRRMVLGLAGLWWRCGDDDEREPDRVEVGGFDVRDPNGNVLTAPAAVSPGGRVLVQVHGAAFTAATAVEAPAALAVESTKLVSAAALDVALRVVDGAAAGVYGFRVTHPELEPAEVAGVVRVARRIPPPSPPPPPNLADVRWRKAGTFVSPEFRRGDEVTVTITSEAIPPDASLELADGFEIVSSDVETGKLGATVRVLESAAPGRYVLRVVAADGTVVGERAEAFEVLAADDDNPSPRPRPKPSRGGGRRRRGGDG